MDKRHGYTTRGGYSKSIVVDENDVFHVPENLDPAAVAALMCAGITTYSPLMHWKVGPEQQVGIVGVGGLGHMALKIAHAPGCPGRPLYYLSEQGSRRPTPRSR